MKPARQIMWKTEGDKDREDIKLFVWFTHGPLSRFLSPASQWAVRCGWDQQEVDIFIEEIISSTDLFIIFLMPPLQSACLQLLFTNFQSLPESFPVFSHLSWQEWEKYRRSGVFFLRLPCHNSLRAIRMQELNLHLSKLEAAPNDYHKHIILWSFRALHQNLHHKSRYLHCILYAYLQQLGTSCLISITGYS